MEELKTGRDVPWDRQWLVAWLGVVLGSCTSTTMQSGMFSYWPRLVEFPAV